MNTKTITQEEFNESDTKHKLHMGSLAGHSADQIDNLARESRKRNDGPVAAPKKVPFYRQFAKSRF